jgi:class 3 adenylate cyclase
LIRTRRKTWPADVLVRLRSRSCIIDGEVVASNESGVASLDPSHSRLCERNFMPQERLQRRLVAILFAYVVGYSRLTGQDELGTWRRLRNCISLPTHLVMRARVRVKRRFLSVKLAYTREDSRRSAH